MQKKKKRFVRKLRVSFYLFFTLLFIIVNADIDFIVLFFSPEILASPEPEDSVDPR